MPDDSPTNERDSGRLVADGGLPTTVVLGDSVAWGQGLSHGEKYASKFYELLSGDSASLPRDAVKAHSGAVIGSSNTTASQDVTLRLATANNLRGTTRQGRREFPYGPFSLYTQLDRLPTDYEPGERPGSLDVANAYNPAESPDVVLVTAGINDIGGGSIANPLAGPENTEKAVKENCYKRMKPFLQDVHQRFPDATIVVAGYHLILSTGPDGSDVVSMEALAAGLTVLFGLFGVTGGAVFAALWGAAEIAEGRAAVNLEYFYQQSTHYLRKAVTEVDNANPGTSVLFASPDFDRENAAAADDPWVFSPGARGDRSVRPDRDAVCEAMAEPPIDNDSVKCPVAPSLHPNADGAAGMARAIDERYSEATSTRSVRGLAENLAADDSGATSVRDSLERYAGVDDLLDPTVGLRTCFDQTVVDSVRVVVETSDDTHAGNQQASVELDLGGFTRVLDDLFGQRLFEHANFSTGATDDFAIDPLFETARTEQDPLRLWEITHTILEQDQPTLGNLINSQWWKVESFELYLNGVKVIDEGPFELDGDDTYDGDYPTA